MRGYFGIGTYHPKKEVNTGSLWRSAMAFNANFMFTIGQRYKRQSSDTPCAYKHIPMYNFKTFEELVLPYNCMLIGVEMSNEASSIENFVHPERAVYLLGAEDYGLPAGILKKCNHVIYIPSRLCLNVAVAGSIVMYDRQIKRKRNGKYE